MKKSQRSAIPCSLAGCEQLQWSRGFCASHYTKFKKDGVLASVKPRGTPKERFEGLYRVDEVTGCWEWLGTKNKGYGIHCGDDQKIVRATRFAYENYVGPIPPGEGVLHNCDNPGCVNWQSHLFTGTQKVNMQDCAAKGRTAGQRGKIGHKLDFTKATNIRVMYARGFSLQTLAEIYSVEVDTLRLVVKGKSHLRPAMPRA